MGITSPPVTIGNTTVGLGNTVTTLGNVTLTNVTISSGTNNVIATQIANGSSNVVIASSGGNISFASGGTQALNIDTNGFLNLLPATSKILGGTAAGRMVMANSDSTDYIIVTGSSYPSTPHQIQFITNTNKPMTMDSAGNLGVGVTPSPWSQGKSVEVGNTGTSLWNSSTQDNNSLICNAYYNSGFLFAGTGYASRYQQNSGVHSWQTSSASGTGGNAITFNTSMTIDSSGNVGIGVTPSAWVSGDTILQIKAGSSSGSLWGRSNAIRVIGNSYFDGANYKYIATDFATQINVNPTSTGGVIIEAAPSGTAGNNATFTQIFAIKKDNSLALQGATSQSGVGISFPASQSASSDANTLDDYEEGTWTPTMVFSGGAGSLSYGTQTGLYTKIGRVVYFNMRLIFNKGTASGTLDNITGLPFTTAGSNNGGGVYIDGMSLLTGACQYNASGTLLYIYMSTTGNSNSINATSMATSGNTLSVSGFYLI